MDRVAGCMAHDTGRVLDALLNGIADEHGISAVELLAGAVIAEGAWNEHAAREHAWPDVSYGFGQPAVKWLARGIVPIYSDDGTATDCAENRKAARLYFWDAERALRYVAPRYARLRATWGDATEAWCRWNKPNVAGRANPNRANYVRALAEAEQYREGDMPDTYTVGQGIKDAMSRYADEPRGDETALTDQYQIAPGRDRLYVYSKAANQVYVIGPKA